MTVPNVTNVQSQKQSKVKDSVESFIKYMILSKSNLHQAKMIQTGTSGEERNDLADDTNDAVDDIVAGLITVDPIFGLAPIREFLGCNHRTNLDPASSPSKKKQILISFFSGI